MSSPVIANCVFATICRSRVARQRRVDRSPAPSGMRGKSSRGHGLEARLEALGRDLDAALVLLDADVGVRQRLDDLEELLGGQRQRPGLGDLGLAPALAGRLRDRWPPAGPRCPWRRSGRWRGWESCSCARRCPGRTAVRAADPPCGRRVPCVCCPRTERDRRPVPSDRPLDRVAVLCFRTNLRTQKYNKNKGLLKSGNAASSPSSSITYGSA